MELRGSSGSKGRGSIALEPPSLLHGNDRQPPRPRQALNDDDRHRRPPAVLHRGARRRPPHLRDARRASCSLTRLPCPRRDSDVQKLFSHQQSFRQPFHKTPSIVIIHIDRPFHLLLVRLFSIKTVDHHRDPFATKRNMFALTLSTHSVLMPQSFSIWDCSCPLSFFEPFHFPRREFDFYATKHSSVERETTLILLFKESILV